VIYIDGVTDRLISSLWSVVASLIALITQHAVLRNLHSYDDVPCIID